MKQETTIQQKIQVYASKLGWRLFRNNCGLAWTGKPIPGGQGTIVLQNARRIRFGLAVGSSDLIGWRSIKVTQDMVGKRMAQFVAVEVKTESGKPTRDQETFLAVVWAAGGHAQIARSEADL